MKSTTWPFIQKDDEGNLILYSTRLFFPFLPGKGYIIPDMRVKKEFVRANIPLFILGFFGLIHTNDYGFYFFIAVLSLWLLMLHIFEKFLLRKYSVSKRKFSWGQRFNEVKNTNTKIKLYIYMFVPLIVVLFFIRSCMNSIEFTSLYISIFGLVVSGTVFLLNLLVIIYKDK